MGDSNQFVGENGINLMGVIGKGNRIRGGAGDDLLLIRRGGNHLAGGRGTSLLLSVDGHNILVDGTGSNYLIGMRGRDHFGVWNWQSIVLNLRALNPGPITPPVVQPSVEQLPVEQPPINVDNLVDTTLLLPVVTISQAVNRPGSQNVFNSPLGRMNFNNAVSHLINPPVTGDRASFGINRNPFE